MRLLNTNTLVVKEFAGERVPVYSILSHTWGKEEVSFQDIQLEKCKAMAGYNKIKDCCAQAARDGFSYVWIDSCCIDKTSSTELSEALNSMYAWYSQAQVCYVYLSDVPSGQNVEDEDSAFQRSRWFTRGWTLQELIAPAVVEFYSDDWREIGTKSSLYRTISRVTGIDEVVLKGSDPHKCSVSQRFYWASKRKTTRIEDQAYCLMGLFDVYMPTLYGEGMRAFFRLQEEILKASEDFTIFAWMASPTSTHEDIYNRGFFAFSPAEFRQSADLQPKMTSSILAKNPPQITSRGLRITLPMKELTADAYSKDEYMACLNVSKAKENSLMFIILKRIDNDLYERTHSDRIFRRSGKEVEKYEPREIYVTSNTGPFGKHRLGLPLISLLKIHLECGPGFEQICRWPPKSRGGHGHTNSNGGSIPPLSAGGSSSSASASGGGGGGDDPQQRFGDSKRMLEAIAFAYSGGVTLVLVHGFRQDRAWCEIVLRSRPTQESDLREMLRRYKEEKRDEDTVDRHALRLPNGRTVRAAIRRVGPDAGSHVLRLKASQ